MKKFFAMLLLVTIVATMAVTSFAAGEGTITLNNIGETSVYEIYKILDLESYNPTTGAYSYKVNAEWQGFFETDEAKAYMAIDDAGYVTWINGEDDESVAKFAQLALAYAQANGISPVKSSEVEGDIEYFTNESGKLSGKFSGLDLGYYLIDSDVGALCGLTTTNPNASVNAKNGIPVIDKQVLEDSTDQWGDSNTADIGQTVNFRLTINVHAGAENYVVHDVMSAGLTFQGVTKVEVIKPDSTVNAAVVPDVDYTVFTAPGITETTDDDVADGCTFEVRFSNEFCASLDTNDKIIIYYNAMLNRDAVIADPGNPNETWLDYGDNHHTTHDTTTTYTFSFDIVKTDSQNNLLDGAEFKIYDSYGTEIKVALNADGTYRRVKDDTDPAIVESIKVTNGMVTVEGFDNGVYYLEETVAPEGYNKLTARHKFTIADKNLDATFNDGIFSTGSGVHVINKTGSMLPETGGFGTVAIVAAGVIVMLGAGVVLFAKKRMSQVAE